MRVNVNEWFFQNKVSVPAPYVLGGQDLEGYEIVRQTEKAVLISVTIWLGDNAYDRNIWVPKSMCMLPEDYNREQDICINLALNYKTMDKEERKALEEERKTLLAKRIAF